MPEPSLREVQASVALDSQPPEALCGNVTVAVEYTCGVNANINNGSSDPDGDMVGCTQSPAGPYPIGTTTVTLTCTDSQGNTDACTGTVMVTDSGSPTLTLLGPAELPVECGSGPYLDHGATANDLCEGDLTWAIARTGDVNVQIPGVYGLQYDVADSAGNQADPAMRVVVVVDTLPPEVILHGPAVVMVECGTPYEDPGVIVVDQCEGYLPLHPIPPPNTNQPGTYSITYRVGDNSGNVSSPIPRIVKVVDTLSPAITILGPLNDQFECGTPYVDPGATANDLCAGDISSAITATSVGHPGGFTITYSVEDPSGNRFESPRVRTVTSSDTLPPTLALFGPTTIVLECGEPFQDPGAAAMDLCDGDLTSSIVVSGSVDTSKNGQYTLTYSVADAEGHETTAARLVIVEGCSTLLSGYNVFLLEHYNGSRDVQGKVAAGGNITMTDFVVGVGLPDSDTARTLVAGGDLTLSRGGVSGDAFYGGAYSADGSVSYPRGTVAQGTPIDFVTRFAELRGLSSRLSGMATHGTAKRTPWGSIMLTGTDPVLNVLHVDASLFNGARMLSVNAPAGSLVVLNIHGVSASFRGFGHSFSGGIDERGLLYNFVEATTITAQDFGFRGTVLAPYAHIHFTQGSFHGGIYAVSLTGNAEGHLRPLNDSALYP